MTDTATTGTTTPPAPATGADDTGATGATEEKPTETVDFWKTKARDNEKRAKANADAATELAALKASQQTAEERLLAEKTAAERDAAEARAETLRYKVATKYGINGDDAETFLTGVDEETLIRQAERLATLAKSADTTSPAPRPDLSQGGRSPSAQSDPAQEFARFISGQINKT